MINLNLVKPQSSITNALVTKPCSNYKINTLKKDCISFTSKPLDVNKCIENLSNIKTDGLFSDKKFEQNDLKILKELLTKDSSKWELVQKLAETRGIGSKTVTAIACCYDKERSDKLIKLFDNLEKLKNNPKNSYSQKEIDALKSSSLNKLNNFDKVIELAKTFKKKDIIQFAKNKSDDEIKNCYDILTNDKYVKKYDTTYKNHIKYDLKTLKSFQSFLKTNLSTKSINQIHALAGKDFSLLGNIINQAEGKKPHYQFEENKCHENEYIIKITTDNNNRCELEGDICLSQKEGFISARISNSNNSTTTSNNKDLRHNITTERIRDNYSDRLLSEKTYKKENGKITNTTIIEKSDITGVYNVYDIDEQGNKTQTCSAKIDKNTGKRTVHKKLKSLDGTITKFEYTQSQNGDKETSYEIVDKDGKVLCKEYLTYEKINKNVIKTTRNGNIYKSWIDNNRLFIYDKKSDYTYSKNLSNLIEVSNPHTKKEIIYNLTKLFNVLRCLSFYKISALF